MEKEILNIIYNAVDNYNLLNPKELHVEKSPNAILLGIKSNIDSLGLMNLLLEIETQINKKYPEFSIIDEVLFNDENGPYKNIENLENFILSKIK